MSTDLTLSSCIWCSCSFLNSPIWDEATSSRSLLLPLESRNESSVTELACKSQRLALCFRALRERCISSKTPPSPCLSGCLRDLASSSNYLGRGVLESCIIDGLCFYSGSPVNIYEERGMGGGGRGGGAAARLNLYFHNVSYLICIPD